MRCQVSRSRARAYGQDLNGVDLGFTFNGVERDRVSEPFGLGFRVLFAEVAEAPKRFVRACLRCFLRSGSDWGFA